MSTTNQINIIDGYNGGVAHIEAAMIRDHNISLYGTGDYVLNVGNKFAHEIVNNNNITIKDGMAVMGGARVSIGYGKTRTAVIENGTSGYKRHDLIVLEYNLDNATLIETAELKVVKGELGTSGVDPDLVTGDIRAGATVHQMALKRVKIDGLNIEAVEDIWTAASLSIIGGGTGANTAEEARQNLGVNVANLGIADYIVETGTLNNWTYIKLNSGRCVAWSTVTYNSIAITIASAAYGGYRSNIQTFTYPTNLFNSVNIILGTKNNTNAAEVKHLEKQSDGIIQFYVSDGASETLSVVLGVVIIGTWK